MKLKPYRASLTVLILGLALWFALARWASDELLTAFAVIVVALAWVLRELRYT